MDPTIQAYATAKDVTEQHDVPSTPFEKSDPLVVSAVKDGDGDRLLWTVDGDENLSKFYTQVSNDTKFHTFVSAQNYFDALRKKPPNEMRLKDTRDGLMQSFRFFCFDSNFIVNFDDEREKARSGVFRASYNPTDLMGTGLSDSKGGPNTAAQDRQK